jgi:hypothetical protein
LRRRHEQHSDEDAQACKAILPVHLLLVPSLAVRRRPDFYTLPGG